MKTKVYNLLILDKSGSMEDIRKEAIDGYNETLEAIKSAQLKHMETQEHFVSLATFCGCGIEMVYNRVPISDANKLKANQYDPHCMTPLFDAIGTTVKDLKKATMKDEDAAYLVTIITDGYENASTEWTASGVGKLIKECKEDGWMFSFIGAGEEIVKVATTISIKNTVVWEKSSVGTKAVFANENRAQERYYDKMADNFCAESTPADRRAMKRKFSEDYYKEGDEGYKVKQ